MDAPVRKKRLLTLRCHGLDLGHNVGLDELVEVDAIEVVDQAKVETLELEAAEVELVEDSSRLQLEQGLELLKRQDGVQVKRLGLEQVLEAANVEVVDLGKLLQ